MMKISYGITVHKEHEELNQLLELLVNETDTEDEIIIVQDGDDKKVEGVISKWDERNLRLERYLLAHMNSMVILQNTRIL